MSKLGKMVKDMVKTKKESVMGKLGDSPYEDPMEPWSVKYNQPVKEETLTEDSVLYRYIRSKGYSPEHMDFAHRSAFARSRAFKTYKVMHQKTIEKPQGGISDIIAHKEEVEHIEEAGAAEIFRSSAENAKAKLASMKAQKTTSDYEKKQLNKVVVGEETKQLSEAGVGKLMNFIKAKGLDPTSMDGNQKKNYSGSSEYRVFKVLHPEDPKKQLLQDKKKKLTKEASGMGERGEDWSDATDEPFVKVKAKSKKLKEEADEVDTVTMDIPLLIRVLEYAREDAKTDMDLHKVVENLIKMRGDGTLSMQSYAKIVAIKEHLESLDELSKETLTSYQHKASVARGQNAIAAIKSKDSDKSKYVSTDKKRTKGLDAVRKRIDSKNKADASKNMDHPKDSDKSKYPLGGRDEVSGRSYSEEVENLSELSKSTLKSYIKGRGETIHADKRDSNAARNTAADAEYHGQQKKADDWHDEADWLRNRARKGATNVTKAAIKVAKKTNEEVEELSELSKATLKSYVDKVSTGPSRGKTQTGTLKSIKAIGGVTKAIRKQYEKPITELKKQADNMDFDDHLTREAANPCWTGYKMVGSKVKAGKTVPNCVPSNRSNIVKSAAKKKIRESMYDWEKDDKGGSKKPNAKVIMKGGTTMTGKPRDTVEIEPVLKTRPNSASGGKPGV